MIITDLLERNARLYGGETSLVEINPSEERDKATTWWDFNLIESASTDVPYRRELTWSDFDRKANCFANLLLSRGLKKGTKVALLLMNFSKSGRTVDESRAWLKRIVITWAILNGLGFIMAYITPFFSDGKWNG